MDEEVERLALQKAALDDYLEIQRKQRPLPRPTSKGRWYWVEWGCEVNVHTKKGKGARLYVTPPGGVEVRITNRIAGGWVALPSNRKDRGVPDSQRRTDGESGPVDGLHSSQKL